MKQLILLFLITLIFACSPKPFESVINNTLPNDVNPEYLKLNFPVGKLSLPGIFLGEQFTPSGSCFFLKNGESATETDSYENFISKAKQEKTFEAGLKAELEKELLEFGLEAEISSLLSSNVTTEIESAKVFTIKPELVLPDFDNKTCRIKDLEFFVNDRIVLIGGIRANKFKLSTKGINNQEQKAKFEAAIKKIDTKFSTNFKKASESEAEISFEASDVYFGALTSKLKTSNCNNKKTLKLKPGNSTVYDLCANFKIRVTKSENFNKKYTINAYTQNGENISIGPYDVDANILNSYSLGTNRQFSIIITEEDNNKQNVSTDILLVGFLGS